MYWDKLPKFKIWKILCKYLHLWLSFSNWKAWQCWVPNGNNPLVLSSGHNLEVDNDSLLDQILARLVWDLFSTRSQLWPIKTCTNTNVFSKTSRPHCWDDPSTWVGSLFTPNAPFTRLSSTQKQHSLKYLPEKIQGWQKNSICSPYLQIGSLSLSLCGKVGT